jgi:hypothetical protein
MLIWAVKVGEWPDVRQDIDALTVDLNDFFQYSFG